jgi:hypothetical protein
MVYYTLGRAGLDDIRGVGNGWMVDDAKAYPALLDPNGKYCWGLWESRRCPMITWVCNRQY